MTMKCPKNPEHKRFSTVAHVMEEWEVDGEGNWIETLDSLEVVHGPNPGNIWTCRVCGVEAEEA